MYSNVCNTNMRCSTNCSRKIYDYKATTLNSFVNVTKIATYIYIFIFYILQLCQAITFNTMQTYLVIFVAYSIHIDAPKTWASYEQLFNENAHVSKLHLILSNNY